MSEDFERIAGIRLLALEALQQAIFRFWGAPPEELMAYLERGSEVLIADSLPKPITDEQLQWIEHEFGLMRHSLAARIRELRISSSDPT